MTELYYRYEYQALESFRHRKIRQIQIITWQLEGARHGIELAENMAAAWAAKEPTQ